MNQEFMNILFSALGVLVTGLFTWVTGYVISFLNSKIKDARIARFLTGATNIVVDAVQSVYQRWVEACKETGSFNAEAQKKAKEEAMSIIFGQFTTDMTQFINDNYGNVSSWVSDKIESVIYDLKNKNQKGGVEE